MRMAATLHLPWARDRRRLRYADALERAVRTARRPAPPGTLTSAIPVQRGAVLQERTLLLELAGRVREAQDAPERALDPVRRLLTDGDSPLYAPYGAGALQDAVVEALLALDDGGSEPE
jgi:hypothetical protein